MSLGSLHFTDNDFDFDLYDESPIINRLEQDEDLDGTEAGPDTKSDAVDKIESLVLSFLTQLSAQPDKSTKIEIQLADRRKVPADGSMLMRSIRFPQKGKSSSSKPLAQLFRVANLMHEALVEDIPTTKRDMYYKYVPLFKTQATVDRLVDDLAATFELGRADLNVRASAKGLICGSSVRMILNDGSSVEPSDSEGSLIISPEDICNFEVDSDLSWVLIVEKEAVFQTLCRLRLSDHPELPGRGIILTGKGYPDVATRSLVKTLAENLPTSIPILGLVDGDPSGLDILSTYIYGSKSMRHENERLAAGKRIQWLGIRLNELASLGVDKDMLLPITKYDQKKAMTMLGQTDPVLPTRWRRELMHMIHARRKAEIEVLSSSGSVSNVSQGLAENILLRYLVIRISNAVTWSLAADGDTDEDEEMD